MGIIIFSGTHNTGKTTLAKAYAERYSYKFNEEGISLLKTKGIKINQEAQEEDQQLIADFIIERFENETGENVVYDRCLLDVYVYSVGNPNISKVNGVPAFFLKKYKNTDQTYLFHMFKQVDRASIIYLMTIKGCDLPLIENGVRSVNVDYRKQIDNSFEGFNVLPKVITLKRNKEEFHDIVRQYDL